MGRPRVISCACVLGLLLSSRVLLAAVERQWFFPPEKAAWNGVTLAADVWTQLGTDQKMIFIREAAGYLARTASIPVPDTGDEALRSMIMFLDEQALRMPQSPTPIYTYLRTFLSARTPVPAPREVKEPKKKVQKKTFDMIKNDFGF